MKQTLTRAYPDGTRATYRLEPGSEAAGALLAPLKPYRLKRRADKRQFPVYRPGIDSTADYIRAYFALNTHSITGKPCAYGSHLDHMTLYAPLPAVPAAVYAGLDSVETIEEDAA